MAPPASSVSPVRTVDIGSLTQFSRMETNRFHGTPVKSVSHQNSVLADSASKEPVGSRAQSKRNAGEPECTAEPTLGLWKAVAPSAV